MQILYKYDYVYHTGLSYGLWHSFPKTTITLKARICWTNERQMSKANPPRKLKLRGCRIFDLRNCVKFRFLSCRHNKCEQKFVKRCHIRKPYRFDLFCISFFVHLSYISFSLRQEQMYMYWLTIRHFLHIHYKYCTSKTHRLLLSLQLT